MKSNYKIAAAVIVCFILGAGAVNVLHAQAKLPAYVVVEIDVKDQDGIQRNFYPRRKPPSKKWAASISQAASIKRSP
jgi:hypothetical protein